MAKRIYNGPCEVVQVGLDDGRKVVLRRGEAVNVSPEQADKLDRQKGLWKTPAASKSANKSPKKQES